MIVVAMDAADKKAVVAKLAGGYGAPAKKAAPGKPKTDDAMARKHMAMEDFGAAKDAKGRTEALLDFLRACGLYSD